MPKHSARAAILSIGAFFVSPATVPAQSTTPSLPGAPQPTPGYSGAPQPSPGYSGGPRLPGGGSGNYSVSAAANEHSTFFWVVDNVQHAVMLCEKTDGARDFTCSKKPLP